MHGAIHVKPRTMHVLFKVFFIPLFYEKGKFIGSQFVLTIRPFRLPDCTCLFNSHWHRCHRRRYFRVNRKRYSHPNPHLFAAPAAAAAARRKRRRLCTRLAKPLDAGTLCSLRLFLQLRWLRCDKLSQPLSTPDYGSRRLRWKKSRRTKWEGTGREEAKRRCEAWLAGSCRIIRANRSTKSQVDPRPALHVQLAQ